MSYLDLLKSATDLGDIAAWLGYSPKGLAYILYKQDDGSKYHTFEVPKRNGGTRTIEAPNEHLKQVQARLAERLLSIDGTVAKAQGKKKTVSHAYVNNRSTITNAKKHTNRRFVFNVDLENFFGAINFGRVRGYFISNATFSLNKDVATVLAQIACYNNGLPQGSPSSPIISELIGEILDFRLLQLAKRYRVTYTRYADDLTFSTNQKTFPVEIGYINQTGSWVPGGELDALVRRSGFTINNAKTRMGYRGSRQTVTGLVVNSKTNVNADYQRSVRAMCYRLLTTGSYDVKEGSPTVNRLEGMLSYVYHVRASVKGEASVSNGFKEQYADFLMHKWFVANEKPVLLCEGKTDVTYIKCAMQSLGLELEASYFSFDSRLAQLLGLVGGVESQKELVKRIRKHVAKYKLTPNLNPTVLLMDNDDAAGGAFSYFSTFEGVSSPITKSTDLDFYTICEGVNLVKLPAQFTVIEDLFPSQWTGVKLEGKPFNPKKKHKDHSSYGKAVFAEQVVKTNANKIDFNQFGELIKRLHFATTKPVS